MTIDEAIEASTEILDIVYNAKSPERSNAIKLGIEALKRVKEARKKAYFTTRSLLPGETEK